MSRHTTKLSVVLFSLAAITLLCTSTLVRGECSDHNGHCNDCLGSDDCCYIDRTHTCVNQTDSPLAAHCSAVTDLQQCFCPFDCNGHGTCNTTAEECDCEEGYVGNDCHRKSKSSSTGIIVGLLVGVVIVAGAVFFFKYHQRTKTSKDGRLRFDDFHYDNNNSL